MAAILNGGARRLEMIYGMESNKPFFFLDCIARLDNNCMAPRIENLEGELFVRVLLQFRMIQRHFLRLC